MGGFSKAYAMTGWRVGYVAAPAAILEGMVKVHQYGIMSAPTTAQDAALAAIVEGEADVERMLAEYDRRRRLHRRRAQRPRARDVRAARRVLRLPADRLDRARRRDVRRAAADRGARRGRARGAPSGRPAPGTCGCATRPRTSAWRRPSADRPVRGAGPRRGVGPACSPTSAGVDVRATIPERRVACRVTGRRRQVPRVGATRCLRRALRPTRSSLRALAGVGRRPVTARLPRLGAPRDPSGRSPASLQRFLDRPDGQRPQVEGRPEVAGLVVRLGRPEPQAALVGDRRRAAGRRPALLDQAAADHERGQRVGRPDPDLGRLLARLRRPSRPGGCR